MHLVRFLDGDGERVGVWSPEGVAPTRYTDMLEVVRGGESALEDIRQDADSAYRAGSPAPVERVLAPLPRPGKMVFCGRNYREHVDEIPGAAQVEMPSLFAKLPNAVVGPGDDIVIPRRGLDVDYEAELAVVIGRRASRVRAEDALHHVFGYTVVNDVSARAIQFGQGQLTLAKGFDTFCPMGPAVVVRNAIPEPASLLLSTHVNGELRQSARAGEMLFPPSRLIEWISAVVTLEPGDVIGTGTPAGVGCFMEPPAFLAPGDEVTVAIDGIGSLTNRVVAGRRDAADTGVESPR